MAGEGGHGLGSARPAKPRRLLPPARSPCPPPPPPVPGVCRHCCVPPPPPWLCQRKTWSRHPFHPQKGSPLGIPYLLFRRVAFFLIFYSEKGFAGEGKAPLAGASSVPSRRAWQRCHTCASRVWGLFPRVPLPFCLLFKNASILAK